MTTVKSLITAIRRLRSINNFSKDQSESNKNDYYLIKTKLYD